MGRGVGGTLLLAPRPCPRGPAFACLARGWGLSDRSCGRAVVGVSRTIEGAGEQQQGLCRRAGLARSCPDLRLQEEPLHLLVVQEESRVRSATCTLRPARAKSELGARPEGRALPGTEPRLAERSRPESARAHVCFTRKRGTRAPSPGSLQRGPCTPSRAGWGVMRTMAARSVPALGLLAAVATSARASWRSFYPVT